MTKVAVVTGSNKGIGFAIVRGLCKSFNGDVYLTSRDVQRGNEAVKILKNEGLNPKFFQLDVTKKDDVMKLKCHLLSYYGGLDVLVNNAGVFVDVKPENIDIMMDTNYVSVVETCESLFPILKKGARVVHISSSLGNYALSESADNLVKQLTEASSIEEVTKQMQMFVSDIKDGTWMERGWAKSPYGILKAGLNMIAPMQQMILDSDPSKEDVIVNSCCPGFVRTDMTKDIVNVPSELGAKTPDEGAETPIYLALLPEKSKSPKGCFCKEKEVIPWNKDPSVKFLKMMH